MTDPAGIARVTLLDSEGQTVARDALVIPSGQTLTRLKLPLTVGSWFPRSFEVQVEFEPGVWPHGQPASEQQDLGKDEA